MSTDIIVMFNFKTNEIAYVQPLHDRLYLIGEDYLNNRTYGFDTMTQVERAGWRIVGTL